MKDIKIGNRLIGENREPLIIAEIGINHNGSLDKAIYLSDKAIKLNMLNEERKDKFLSYKEDISQLKKICEKILISPNDSKKLNINLSADGKKRSLYGLMGFDNINREKLEKKFSFFCKYDKRTVQQLMIQSKYDTHVTKQKASIFSYKQDKKIKIPKNIDYKKIGGLSRESYEALVLAKPRDLATASRIPGVTAAALSSVLLFTKKKVKKVV